MADKKDQFYTPPPKLTGWESFKLFLWNGETSEVLGRTGASWGKPYQVLLFFASLVPSVIFQFSFGFFSGRFFCSHNHVKRHSVTKRMNFHYPYQREELAHVTWSFLYYIRIFIPNYITTVGGEQTLLPPVNMHFLMLLFSLSHTVVWMYASMRVY